eukprot:31239_1
MSHNITDRTFDFNVWLTQHNLLKYKRVFTDCKMTDLQSLDVNHTSFATLITDSRLNGNDLIVQNIVKSIQALQSQYPVSNTETSIKQHNEKQTNGIQMKELIKQQHYQLNKLIITQNKNKQKYSKYFFQQDTLTEYIEKIKISKTNVSKAFEVLRQLINNEEKRILNEILKQETNALYIQSNINNNKKNGHPIQHKLHLNDTLIENYAKLLNDNSLEYNKMKNESDNIFSDIDKNNENIENILAECDYCTLSMPHINQIIYNKISNNIHKIANFICCCPIKINIVNINFMNANSIRIIFNVLPQRNFKQCQVFYNYNSEQKTDCNWHKSTEITSLLY